MSLRAAAAFLSLGAILAAQGTEPRPKASEYPAHAAAGDVAIGAEYMVRSFQGRNHTFVVKDYLVVEVALYMPRFEKLTVSHGHFSLRVNGKKTALVPQSPYMVAASLKYEDWERRPTVVAGAGVGDAGIIIGRPEITERFPGDRRPADRRLPPTQQPPKAPDQPQIEAEEPVLAHEIVTETALPEGEASGPVSGYLYFAFKGKPKSIRSLELIYRGPAGAATLPLI